MSKRAIPLLVKSDDIQPFTKDPEFESLLFSPEATGFETAYAGMSLARENVCYPRLLIVDENGNRLLVERVYSNGVRCELHVVQSAFKPEVKA